MNLIISQNYSFDVEAERRRINAAFSEEWQKRLLPIVDAFESMQWELCETLYENLPYDFRMECAGQEFVHHHMMELVWTIRYHAVKYEKVVV